MPCAIAGTPVAPQRALRSTSSSVAPYSTKQARDHGCELVSWQYFCFPSLLTKAPQSTPALSPGLQRESALRQGICWRRMQRVSFPMRCRCMQVAFLRRQSPIVSTQGPHASTGRPQLLEKNLGYPTTGRICQPHPALALSKYRKQASAFFPLAQASHNHALGGKPRGQQLANHGCLQRN